MTTPTKDALLQAAEVLDMAAIDFAGRPSLQSVATLLRTMAEGGGEEDSPFALGSQTDKRADTLDLGTWIHQFDVRSFDYGPGERLPEDARTELGRLIRCIWVRWARTQAKPKPSWLLPWESISDADREIDTRMGDALFRLGEEWSRISRLPALEKRCEELEAENERQRIQLVHRDRDLKNSKTDLDETDAELYALEPRHLRTVQAARKAIRYWRQRCGAAEAYIEILEELVGVWRIENGLCGATCQDARAAHQRAKERR